MFLKVKKPEPELQIFFQEAGPCKEVQVRTSNIFLRFKRPDLDSLKFSEGQEVQVHIFMRLLNFRVLTLRPRFILKIKKSTF